MGPIPDKWGLLVYLNEHDAVDIATIKRFMNDIVESCLMLAEDNLPVAEKLFETGLSSRTVIHKSYYSMYHAARSAVYAQMQLDVKEHRSLVNRFKNLLARQFGDEALANRMNTCRTKRIECDYYPDVEVVDDVCKYAISDAATIVSTCKSLVEVF